MSGLSSVLVGAAGGLAIDARIGRRPSIAAPTAAIIAFAATALIGTAMGSITLDQAAPNMTLGLGWLVGLASAPGADDMLRRRALSHGALLRGRRCRNEANEEPTNRLMACQSRARPPAGRIFARPPTAELPVEIERQPRAVGMRERAGIVGVRELIFDEDRARAQANLKSE